MNASDIFTEARKLAFVNATQFDNTQLTMWLNFVYQELCGDIKKLNENYFKVRGYIDTVPFQNNYTFALPTSTVASVQKILQLSVKYEPDIYPAWVTGTTYAKGDKVMNSGKTYVANVAHTAGATFAGDAAKRVQIWEGYSDARELNYAYGDIDTYNIQKMDAFVDRYGKAIDINNPLFVLSSSTNQMTLSIYPYAEDAVTQGIKYEGIATILDLSASSVEADILIDRNYHKVLVLGIIPYIYQARGLLNERTDAINAFEMYKSKMLSEITDRVWSATDVRLPNLIGIE